MRNHVYGEEQDDVYNENSVCHGGAMAYIRDKTWSKINEKGEMHVYNET